MLKDDVEEEEIIESDVELSDSEVVEPDFEPPIEIADPSVEVTEEIKIAAEVLKSIAMEAVLDGKLDVSMDYLTKAIFLNPNSAILFASRAIVFVKMKKPNAARRDADKALEINPHLAKAYKARGMARALLGFWDVAAEDLHEASKLDFDEETSMMLKKFRANAKKVGEHRHKYEQLRKERDLRKAERERLKLSKEAEFASILKDGQVIEIESGSELEIKLNAASEMSRLAVVYFTATWSGPCRYVAPVYASLAAKHPKVVFLKVDFEKAYDAAARWKVSSIPSFYFSKSGKIVEEEVNNDVYSLEEKIAEHAG